MASVLLRIIFAPPPSLFIAAMSAVSLVSLTIAGLSETRGKHLQYSKFWNVNPQKSVAEQIKLSGRSGMLVLYTPAFLAGLVSFGILPRQDLRLLLLRSALTVHFFKRMIEVLFVHKYSGSMVLDSVITISLSYFVSTATMIYAQCLTQGLPQPSIDLKYAGTLLFLIGIGGNFYHHYLLSKMRSKNDKAYKVPKGALFDMVVCPHYLFEIIGFWGIAFISQTVYAASFALGTTFYLMGRSWVTRSWYISKFEDFPENVKALIPFIF